FRSPSFSTATMSKDVPVESRSSRTSTGDHPSAIASRSSAMTGSSPHPATSPPLSGDGGLGDLLEDLPVRLGDPDLVDEHLQGGGRVERVQHPSEAPDQGELLRGHQALFLPRPRGLDVEGGEDALLRERPVKPDLPVPRSLELL